MILIGIGGNVPSEYGSPYETCLKAVQKLDANECRVIKTSKWYMTAPVPLSDMPWYVNAVAQIETDKQPEELLRYLHDLEHSMGRTRQTINSPRKIDLDLLDYNGMIRGDEVILPHPRMHKRAFVLIPLRDVCHDWKHPVTGQTVSQLMSEVPRDQDIVEID